MHCQKCRSPLRLDSSLYDLNPSAFKLLADASLSPDAQKIPRTRKTLPNHQQERLADYDDAAENARPATIKQSFTQSRSRKENPSSSYVMLNESQVLESPSRKSKKSSQQDSSFPNHHAHLKERTEMAESIFDVLSSRTDIDHPICNECTDTLIQGFQKRLTNVTKERDAYIEFLRQANADIPSEDEVKQAEKEYQKAKKQEEQAFAELRQLEEQQKLLEEEIQALDQDVRDLEIKEESFWEKRNEYAMQLNNFRNEKDRVNNQNEFDSKQLERFKRANVYNDTFSIGHDGYFGTINRLRLGRLPDKPVEWSEINAAWGHACLLLTTVASRLKFDFYGYEIKPMGSTSNIIEHVATATSSKDPKKKKAKVHELYTSGDYSFGMGFLTGKFDSAMIAFLECLRQLIVHAQKTKVLGTNGKRIIPPDFPYVIDKDMIGDCSIKLGSGFGSSQEFAWTKACKAALISCKFLLAHASNVSELADLNQSEE
jgi:beclin 1